jgi:glycosyltransferase involved in cell wall biosynthesis
MEVRRGVCSIVIPVFNREKTVAETVGSCLAQDYPHVEIILVDDGSTDASLAICEKLETECHCEGKTVRVFHQRNAGACAARNRGMALATGEFVLFLDSDDIIPSRKLSIQIAAMERVRADCSISDFQTIDASGQVMSVYRNNRAPAEFITRLKCPSNSAILMRRSSLPTGLQWNTSLRRMQDFDFMLRYLSGVKTWAYVPEPLYHYRLHEGPRISDTYLDGMPYLEMFWSMIRHLRLNPPATLNRASLLARYGGMLLRAHLKDTASHILPVSVKKLLKQVF